MQQQLLQTMLVDISAVLTGEQMKIIYSDYMWVGRFDADNLRSASEVLGKYQMAAYQCGTPYVSAFANLQPIRNIIFILLSCRITTK